MKHVRVYYRLGNDNRRLGGVRVIYEHMDILNKHGYEAYVLHDSSHFRCALRQTHSGPVAGGD